MTVQVRSSLAVWGLATVEEMCAPKAEPTLGAVAAAGKIPDVVTPSIVMVPLHGLVTAPAGAIAGRDEAQQRDGRERRTRHGRVLVGAADRGDRRRGGHEGVHGAGAAARRGGRGGGGHDDYAAATTATATTGGGDLAAGRVNGQSAADGGECDGAGRDRARETLVLGHHFLGGSSRLGKARSLGVRRGGRAIPSPIDLLENSELRKTCAKTPARRRNGPRPR